MDIRKYPCLHSESEIPQAVFHSQDVNMSTHILLKKTQIERYVSFLL